MNQIEASDHDARGMFEGENRQPLSLLRNIGSIRQEVDARAFAIRVETAERRFGSARP